MSIGGKIEAYGSWIEEGTAIDPEGRPAQRRYLDLEALKLALGYSLIANDVYGDRTGQASRGGASLVKNWIELISEDNKGQDVTLLRRYSVQLGKVFGFNAALYQTSGLKSKFALAFEGSGSMLNPKKWNDWILTNIPTVLSGANALEAMFPLGVFTKFFNPNGAPSTQYDIAHHVAEIVVKTHGVENVVMVGHSLGGGLAQYASLKTGCRTIVFNSAGIGGQPVKSGESRALNRSVAHLFTSGDFVNDRVIQDKPFFFTGLLGIRSRHFGVGYDVGPGAHGMAEGVIPAINRCIAEISLLTAALSDGRLQKNLSRRGHPIKRCF